MAGVWHAFLQFKYTPVILLILGIIGATILYRVLTRAIRRYAVQRAFKAQNVLTFFFVWRYTFMFVATVLLIFFFGEAFSTLGISLLLLSSVMSWALRNPIMNLAGWLMLILRKPYRVGDRVILGGLVGDVKDITVTYTVLDQVGGTVGSEEKSGRSLLVPNLHLFNWTIVNYTLDDKYILDEVPVRLTYDSDIDRAEEILLQHAREVAAEAIEETGEQPFVRFEFIPSGVVARLRYRVAAIRRPEISSRIVDRVFREFHQTEGIRFAYVQSEVLMSPADPQSPPPPQHPSWFRDGMLHPWFSAIRPSPGGFHAR